MNNLSSIVIIGWETRNSKHREKALKWCKDYGFEPILRNTFIGELYAKEKKELNSKLKGLFVGKTEKFFFAAMCRACFNGSISELQLKKVVIKSELPFELIQRPQK